MRSYLLFDLGNVSKNGKFKHWEVEIEVQMKEMNIEGLHYLPEITWLVLGLELCSVVPWNCLTSQQGTVCSYISYIMHVSDRMTDTPFQLQFTILLHECNLFSIPFVLPGFFLLL